MKKTRVDINISDFPEKLRSLFENAKVYDSSSHSEAEVLFLDTGYYVKIQEKGTLSDEAHRSILFDQLGLGVPVCGYISEGRDYLVTRMAEGEDLTHHLDDPERLCRVLADSLRMLHSRPVSGVGIAPGFRHYLEAAENGEGHFEDYVVMKRFPVTSREEAWEIMQANKHRLKADTLIHGDACLPNVILKDGQFSTFIDFSQSGVGDRHMDLYWAVWSLQFNLGTEDYTDYFLECYGRENFDPEMLRIIAAFEAFG